MSFLDRPPDPYVALGISKDAKLPDIRSAHRKLTLKLHPDRCHDPTLKAVRQEEWMKVQQAYELLSDDTLRVQYDKQVKLFEMRKEMGRNYPKTRSNPFEFEIKRAEPKSPSHYSAPSHPNWMAKEYVQAAQRKEAPSERSRKRDKERVPSALPRADTLRAGDRVRGGEGSKLKNNVEYHEYDHDFDDSDSDPQPQLQSSKRNPLHPPGFSSLHKHTPWGDDDAVQIEEGIKERNRKAYEHFKTSVSEISQPSSFSRDGKIDSKADDPKSGDQIESKQPLPKLKLSSVPPSQLGLNVLNPETTNAAVDIVAVHGLGAIPEITWKDSKSGVNWLSDGEMLPKSVPEARIMRFGYDSLWLGKTPVRQKLSTIANKLLLVLSRERRVRWLHSETEITQLTDRNRMPPKDH
jgi:curved DNA-binding protein CbpA